jgi:hypothetical protein
MAVILISLPLVATSETYRAGNHFMHTTYLGAVVQRELVGIDEHSYHQVMTAKQ